MILTGTDFLGKIFKNLQLEGAQLVSNEFHDCKFFHCTFVETIFQGCRFVNCIFQHCDLSLVQVPDSLFTNTHFEDSKVIGVNWAKAKWSATNFSDSIGFSKCVLSHSTFIGLNLSRFLVLDCMALDVDFRECDLSQADFSGTDLSESLFLGTNLTKADLSRARNYHIDPSQNILNQAKFSLPEAMSLLYSLDIDLSDE